MRAALAATSPNALANCAPATCAAATVIATAAGCDGRGHT
eukprot:CAMPEP_0183336616 /NCGR_PEP_ID=MMETSP0164_2-20130417/4547_1 /TAXON_ID=221442 /ORGANISM="Coccolithus pelagicus ssp braarudi, Strain PLY182g" /LENGTH=39 /DNA_ID= /DNA_START= /DNA_END= /DNA_ORIENTATION=